MSGKYCKDCVHYRVMHTTVWDYNSCANPVSAGKVEDVVNGVIHRPTDAYSNRSEHGDCKPEGLLFEKRTFFNVLFRKNTLCK